MSKEVFFNGAESADIAGINVSTSTLPMIIKNVFAVPANVDTIRDILDDELLGKYSKVDALVKAVRGMEPLLKDFVKDEVYYKLSRRLNYMSRTNAKINGVTAYQKLADGRVKKAELLLEHKA